MFVNIRLQEFLESANWNNKYCSQEKISEELITEFYIVVYEFL